MPRDRKVRPSQSYGEANAAQESLRQIPLPEASDPGGAGPGDGAVPDPRATALAAAQAEAPPAGGFGDPTTRPNEPITAGLNVGAGPGPEALGPRHNRNRISEHFELLSMIGNGNPIMAALARRARMQGL